HTRSDRDWSSDVCSSDLTLYPPQAFLPGTPGASWGIILMLLSLAIFIVAFTMGGLNYVTTVLQARCRGMTLLRMPLSVWGIFMADRKSTRLNSSHDQISY